MLGWNGVLNTSMITIAWWEPSNHSRIWIPWETWFIMQSFHKRQQKLICIASFSSLYIAMGFFGYLKYGADIASTITLNMDLVCFNLFVLFFTSTSPSITMDLSPHPSALALSSSSFLPYQAILQEAPLAQAALGMFGVAIFFSYAIQVCLSNQKWSTSTLSFSSTWWWTSSDQTWSDQMSPRKG